MAAVAAVQFGGWFLLWREGVARAPLIGLYDIVALTGLGVALIIFFLWHLLAIYRQGEVSPAKRILRDFDGPVVLIGKSMGSRIGCHLALEEDVAALVCLGYPL